MKDPIKFTDIESQGLTILAGIILIAMTIWLNNVAGPLWASIFAIIGIVGIFLRAWRRSVNTSTNTVLSEQISSKPIDIDDFDIIENPGVAIHKKTQEIFCLKCLLQKSINSPLIIDHSKGYMCRNCEDIIFHLDNWHEFIQFSKEWRVKTI